MKWAIIGTGNITKQFITDSGLVKDADIVAVVSRSKESGEAFASKHGIPKVYTDYQELLDNEEIDNIYVGTPHTTHLEVANYFLNKGKNVLCEKPLAVNKAEAEKIIETAKANDCLLMEAMWTLFFPSIIKTKELVDNKHFGKVNSVSGRLGFGSNDDHDRWRYHNDMAGGALLDLGIYPIHFYLYLFDGMPKKYEGFAEIRNGVDINDKVVFDFDGTLAGYEGSIVNDYIWGYDIFCEKGSIHLNRLTSPYTMTLRPFGGEEEIIDFSFERGGMQYQIEAFDNASKQGLKECPPVTYERTLEAMTLMDGLRKKWNLVYPSDLK